MNTDKRLIYLVVAIVAIVAMASTAQATNTVQADVQTETGQVQQITQTENGLTLELDTGEELVTEMTGVEPDRYDTINGLYVLNHQPQATNSDSSNVVVNPGEGVATTGQETFLYDHDTYRFKYVDVQWQHQGEQYRYQRLDIEKVR